MDAKLTRSSIDRSIDLLVVGTWCSLELKLRGRHDSNLAWRVENELISAVLQRPGKETLIFGVKVHRDDMVFRGRIFAFFFIRGRVRRYPQG